MIRIHFIVDLGFHINQMNFKLTNEVFSLAFQLTQLKVNITMRWEVFIIKATWRFKGENVLRKCIFVGVLLLKSYVSFTSSSQAKF